MKKDTKILIGLFVIYLTLAFAATVPAGPQPPVLFIPDGTNAKCLKPGVEIPGTGGVGKFRVHKDDTVNRDLTDEQIYDKVTETTTTSIPVWTRDDTTDVISPYNANDGLDMGTGTITGGHVVNQDGELLKKLQFVYVNDSSTTVTGVVYDTVQAAINYVGTQAGNWIIEIAPGTYTENISIAASGWTPSTCLVRGAGYSHTLIYPASAASPTVTIESGIALELDDLYIVGQQNVNIDVISCANVSAATPVVMQRLLIYDASTTAHNAISAAAAGAPIASATLSLYDIYLLTGATVTGVNVGANNTVGIYRSTIQGAVVGLTTGAGATALWQMSTLTGCTADFSGSGTVTRYKAEFANIESTNMPTVGGTSLSSTFAPIAAYLFDRNATTNTVSTHTANDNLSIGTGTLTAGKLVAPIQVIVKTDSYTLAAAESKLAIVYLTVGTTGKYIETPQFSATYGDLFLICGTAAYAISYKANASDTVYLSGVALSAGHLITSDGSAGALLLCQVKAAGVIYCWPLAGVWTDGGT